MTTLPALAWRPGHLAARDEVHVEVGDGFAGVGAIVNHDAKAGGEVEFLRNHAGNDEEVAEDGLVFGGGFADARYQFFRDDEEVRRRLRLDVVENDTAVVLVFDFGGDFAIDDFLEDRFGHGQAGWPRQTKTPRTKKPAR